ncbi:MAG: DUF4058 family protein [Planctomycetes bacterium]|nr:DUF4058 family protein [Planctomycetota bacterium]
MDSTLKYRFPGMDPWLEHPGVWPGAHDALVIHLAEELTRQLAPRYVAWPGQRLVVELPERVTAPHVSVVQHSALRARAHRPSVGPADEPVLLVLEPLEVRETFVEIRSVHHDRRLVTVLEVLSHANKRTGTDSRAKYLQKQEEVLASDVHLVEIDLLRAGEHTVALPLGHLGSLPPHEYRVVLRRADFRERAEVHPIRLRDRLPRVSVPLLAPDSDAVLDLQVLMVRVFEAGAYGLGTDYSRSPKPALEPGDRSWARRLLRSAGTGDRRGAGA